MTKRKMTEMTKRKMTDGERIAKQIGENWGVDDKHARWKIAPVIDRLIRKRMAEAWLEGWRRSAHEFPGNPYRGSKQGLT